jgi:hypothetical protein
VIDGLTAELHAFPCAARRATALRLIAARDVRLEVCLAVFARLFGIASVPTPPLTSAGQLAPMLQVEISSKEAATAYAHLVTQVLQDFLVLAQRSGDAAAMLRIPEHVSTLKLFAQNVGSAIADYIGSELHHIEIASSIIQAHLAHGN